MRPVGPDISKYQAPQDLAKPHNIDFATMVDKSAFLIMRAGFAGSAGGAWTDPRVHDYMKDLETILLNNPIPFTFYWYFRDNVSIMDQVNRFSAVINRYKEVVNLPLVVDAEAFVKSNLVSTQKIIDFQTEVERQTGLLVDTLYGRAGQLNSETTPGLPAVLPHLHVARYTSGDPQSSEPWDEGGVQEYVEPRDYDEWVFWQYTEDGDEKEYGVHAGSIGIDLSVFNGTMAELRSLANLDKPKPPATDWDIWGKVTADHKIELIGPRSAYIEFFAYDVSWEPQVLTITGTPGVKATISLFINGFEIILRKTRIYSSGYTTYTFQRDFNFGKADGVLVTLDNSSAEPVTVGMTLALEKYGDN